METPTSQHKDGVPTLSQRGKAQVEEGKLLLPYKPIMESLYDPVKNPEGFIHVGVAENTLLHEELARYYESKFKIEPIDFTYGDGLGGTSRMTSALCSFFNSYFSPIKPVTRDQLITATGASPIVNQCVRALADPKDGVLIAAPYYPGFDNDLRIMSDVNPVPVPIPASDMFTLAEIGHLEEAMTQGHTVRAVILCNPHNPLGRCYPKEVIIAYAQFCEKHNLHLISDEIYALSVFPTNDVPSPQEFISVLSIDFSELNVKTSRIHVVYGMSKDFDANGFRVGVLISQDNPDLIQSMTSTFFFTMVASTSSYLWSALLNDADYLPIFIKENQTKLRQAYEFVTDWLKFHQIAYEPSNAGHFLMVDMRGILSNVSKYGDTMSITADMDMARREGALMMHLIGHKVLIMPGAMCHHPQQGWFRLTFAMRSDYVRIALNRMEKAFKLEHWSELDG